MNLRSLIYGVALCLSLSNLASAQSATVTERDLISRLEKEGYSQVEVRSSPEGLAVKAMKDGKDVALVVDSSGKIQERSRP